MNSITVFIDLSPYRRASDASSALEAAKGSGDKIRIEAAEAEAMEAMEALKEAQDHGAVTLH